VFTIDELVKKTSIVVHLTFDYLSFEFNLNNLSLPKHF